MTYRGTYPVLKPLEIVTALEGWGISISKEQLARPTPEFVETIFCACLRRVTNISDESLAAPMDEILEHAPIFEEREWYMASLAASMLIEHLRRFAEAARIENFSSRDLSQPEAERTTNVLSGFINFIRFIEQECEDYVKNTREKSDTFHDERRGIEEKIQVMTKKIEEMKKIRGQEEPRILQLKIDNNRLKNELRTRKDEYGSAKRELEDLKSKKEEVIAKQRQTSDAIRRVELEIRSLKSKLVPSPDRLRKDIEEVQAQTARTRQAASYHESEAKLLIAKSAALRGIEQDLKSCVEQLRIIEDHMVDLQESRTKLAESKSLLDKNLVAQNGAQLQKAVAEKQLISAQDKLQRALQHAEEKRAASQRTLERLHREYEQMKHDRQENAKEIQKLQGETEQIEAQMATHLKQSEAELNELLAAYWKFRNETEVYMNALANKLDMNVIVD